MVWKIISTILYVIAGFFIYLVSLLAFYNKQPITMMEKLAILGGFSVPIVIFLLIAAAFTRFKKWKSSVAITFFWGIGFTSFCIITFTSFYLSSETRKIFPKETFDAFTDYLTGATTILIFLGLGIVLYMSEKRKADC